MVELAWAVLVFDFDVRDRRETARTPINDALAAIDQPLLPPAHEAFHHRVDVPLIHREARSIPIKGTAQPLKLRQNHAAGLVDPLPGSFDEFFAAQIVASEPLFSQLLLDYVLSGDTGVVGAGHTKRVVALHSLPSDQHILDGVAERMAYVKRARNVGRWDRDAVFRSVAARFEIASRIPDRIPLLLDAVRLISFGQFRHMIIIALRAMNN